MIFSLEKNSAGELAGCASSGAAKVSQSSNDSLSIRKALIGGYELKPLGYYHPRTYVPTSDNCAGAYTASTDWDYINECGNPVAKWKIPDVGNDALEQAFAAGSDNQGDIISRQCFKQNSEGKYVIDTDKINTTNGYELVDMQDTNAVSAKVIAPPDFGNDIKEFTVDVKE